VSQRDALHQLVKLQEGQSHRRGRLVGQLRELLVLLESVRAQAHAALQEGVTEELRSVCEDMRRLAYGYRELADEAAKTRALPVNT
jgi:hypothetical protein